MSNLFNGLNSIHLSHFQIKILSRSTLQPERMFQPLAITYSFRATNHGKKT